MVFGLWPWLFMEVPTFVCRTSEVKVWLFCYLNRPDADPDRGGEQYGQTAGMCRV